MQHFLHHCCRYCDEPRDDNVTSAVVISSATGRLSYSPQIVPGKKGQDNQCFLSAGQYLNSQLRFVAGWRKGGVFRCYEFACAWGDRKHALYDHCDTLHRVEHNMFKTLQFSCD